MFEDILQVVSTIVLKKLIQNRREITQPTVSEVADLQVPVHTDHSHRDEASAAKEESRPAVESATFPAKQPAV